MNNSTDEAISKADAEGSITRFRFFCVNNVVAHKDLHQPVSGEAFYAISSQIVPAGTSHEELEEKIEKNWPASEHLSCVKGDKTAVVYYLPASIFFPENAHFTNLRKGIEETLSFTIDNDKA